VAPPTRKRRLLRALAAVALGVPLALGTGELGLRWLMFGDSDLARELGARWREPGAYADADSDDTWWVLQRRFAGAELVGATDHPDPVVGWTGSHVEPGTYAHVDEPSVGARTPVLLFGDSFAECTTRAEDCFQGLLDRSDLADRYRLLNYGVGGFGLDQTYLMMRQALDRFEGRNPIVVVGILVESDLDRSVLGFRGWPKPRFSAEGGELTLAEPLELDAERWIERYPLQCTSWLARLLIYRAGALPAEWRKDLVLERARIDEKRKVNARILEELSRELARRNVRGFALLFHVKGPLPDDGRYAWQQPFLQETLPLVQLPYVDTGPYLLFAAGGDPGLMARFYLAVGPEAGHHNPLGNRIAFEALRQGLEGRFGGPDTTRLAHLIETGDIEPPWLRQRTKRIGGLDATITVRSLEGCVRHGDGLPPFFDTQGREALAVRGGENGPTEIEFALAGKWKRFKGVASHLARITDDGCGGAQVELLVFGDGRGRAKVATPPGAKGVPFEVDVAGVDRLVLRVRPGLEGAACNWIGIDSPRFE
jgi:hypothetical protein